jgi:superfamily II helicase
MTDVSNNVPVTTPEAAQNENLLQLSAQVNSTKQLADELMTANVNLRAQAMVLQHHLNAAKEINAKLEVDKGLLDKEIESLKLQIAEFTKPQEASQDQEAAA